MRPGAKIPQLIVAAMLMLAGASMSLAQQGTTMAGSLTGSEWRVESIGGVGVGADSRASITIAGDGRSVDRADAIA